MREEGENMDIPKTTTATAVKIFLYSLLAAVLCFFLHMSLTMALSTASTQKIGQSMVYTLEDGRMIVSDIYDEAFVDDEHQNKTYFLEDDGSEIVIPDDEVKNYTYIHQRAVNIRTEVDPLMRTITDVVAQVLMLILFLAFPYSTVWYLGDHDRNQVQFGHAAENPWRGVVIGALASIPATLMWLLLLVGKVSGLLPDFVTYYRWFNWCVLPYFNQFVPESVTNPAEVSWLAVAAMIPVLLSLPVIAGIGYRLGYKDFSVRDRLVYSATGKKPKRRRK